MIRIWIMIFCLFSATGSCNNSSGKIIKAEEWKDVERPDHTEMMHRYNMTLKNIYKRIIFHHSAFSTRRNAAYIRRYQMLAMGYSDISYHYFIDRRGTIYEGRKLYYMGAHAGRNPEADLLAEEIRKGNAEGPIETALKMDPDWGSVGICLAGNFTVRAPRKRQLKSMSSLVNQLMDSLSISGDSLILHREINAGTVCPGERGSITIKKMIRLR